MPLAQAPPPEFEIASIKINANRDARSFYQAVSDRLTVANVPLRMVLTLAYGVDRSQIVGAPDWADQDRFDIVAKAAAPFIDANRVATSGRMRVRGLPLTGLASLLSSEVGQEIRDETGLTGEFDWELTLAPRRTDADGPSVFTAVREQLGLRLEPRRSTLDVIVIDHVERPVPD